MHLRKMLSVIASSKEKNKKIIETKIPFHFGHAKLKENILWLK